GPATSATVTVNPAGLQAGYNRSSVTVNSSSGSRTVPVVLFISKNTFLSLSPAVGQFSLPAGNILSPNTGTFQFSVNSPQSVNWTASVAPGAPWLSTSTTSGQSTSQSAGSINYSIDTSVAAQLAQGTYYGDILVRSNSTANLQVIYQVILFVTSPSSAP